MGAFKTCCAAQIFPSESIRSMIWRIPQGSLQKRPTWVTCNPQPIPEDSCADRDFGIAPYLANRQSIAKSGRTACRSLARPYGSIVHKTPARANLKHRKSCRFLRAALLYRTPVHASHSSAGDSAAGLLRAGRESRSFDTPFESPHTLAGHAGPRSGPSDIPPPLRRSSLSLPALLQELNERDRIAV